MMKSVSRNCVRRIYGCTPGRPISSTLRSRWTDSRSNNTPPFSTTAFPRLSQVKENMNAVRNTIAENFGGPSNKLVPEKDRFTLEQVPDLAGKVAVVTGGTEGIGYGNTHTLLSHNIDKVYIITPSQEIYAEFQQNIRDDLGASFLDRVIWKQCDLSNLNEIAQVATGIAKEANRIDILINGAGRGIMSYDLSVDNIDLHMAINHFGHVVLTSHLLPVLKKTSESSPVRIVNISSNQHQSPPKDTKFQSLEELNQDYGASQQYGRSKLANLLYARYLARELSTTHPNIHVNASHPGVVETRQSEQHVLEPYPVLGHLVKAMKPIKKDVFDGCVSTMYCATVTESTGEYVCPPKVVEKGSDESNDMALAESLMRLTKEIIDAKTDARTEGCPLSDH